MNKIRALTLISIIVLALAATAACVTDEESQRDIGRSATAAMIAPDGESVGMVTLTETSRGVLVAADVSGLVPGGHGFHIHEVGACEPDFSAAADHYAPMGAEHGYMNPDGHHAGDLPNIYAGDDGSARADYFTSAITLSDGETSVFDDNGSAIIIHEKPDTYGADAGAGGRVACGVITR